MTIDFDALPPQQIDASPAPVSRGRSATAMMPIGLPSRATSTGVRPAAPSPSSRVVDLRRAEPALLEQPMIAEQRRGAPSTRPSAPRPGSAVTRVGRRGRDAAPLRRSCRIACAIGMLRPLLDRRGQRRRSTRRRAPFERDDVDDLRRAARQRAGLVERDAADAAGALEVHAALDEHALARRAGQRRDDRHRRRDDERARARDDEQHERAIDPVVPARAERRAAERPRPPPPARCTDRRVDAREALDEGLRRRPLRLRALDEVDDPRQRGVAPEPRDADLERAAAVDGAGEHFVARRLVDRQRLAGDRRLVDRALRRRRPSPSSGIFSPGLMTMTAPGAIASTPTRRSPAASRTSASAGVRSISARIAWRARSSVRASSACATANRKTTAAASDHCRSDDRAGRGDRASGR